MTGRPPDADARTPASLLDRVRTLDDVAGWNRFVDLYTPLLVTWVRALGVPAADRADVVQTVFAQLVKELPGFRYDPARRFRGYLFAIARSRAVDLLRARKLAVPISAAAGGTDPAAAAVDEEYNRYLVHRADRILAADFDPVTREAFRRYAVDGEAPRAVAASLGIAVASVYQAKSRVTKRLKEELAGLLD